MSSFVDSEVIPIFSGCLQSADAYRLVVRAGRCGRWPWRWRRLVGGGGGGQRVHEQSDQRDDAEQRARPAEVLTDALLRQRRGRGGGAVPVPLRQNVLGANLHTRTDRHTAVRQGRPKLHRTTVN